jgi:uncharacterized protein
MRIAECVEAQARRSKNGQTWDPVFTADYRWEHTLRVAQYGREIADGEGVDQDLALAACLLHDIAYFSCAEEQNWDEHGRIGARLSRPILKTAGYDPAECDAICHAVAVHVDGKADDGLPPSRLDDVVSDADNVDRFSAYRVVAWCMTEREDLQKMAAMLCERLIRLRRYRAESPLATKTGKALFASQVNRQIAFFEALVHDAEITRLPSLDGSP